MIMRNISIKIITFSILLIKLNIINAAGFPDDFFGISVGKTYDSHKKLDVEITDFNIGSFDVGSLVYRFKPSKDRPMFPLFKKTNEEAYNYIVSLPDWSNGKDSSRIIVSSVGWRIRKPFIKSYSYISKMNDICNMFKADLGGMAESIFNYNDILDEFTKNKSSVKNIEYKLRKDKKTACYFRPKTPRQERMKKYKSYDDYVHDHKTIYVLYDIKSLYDAGPEYESLSVFLGMKHNSLISAIEINKRIINNAVDKLNNSSAIENANKSRPY